MGWCSYGNKKKFKYLWRSIFISGLGDLIRKKQKNVHSGSCSLLLSAYFYVINKDSRVLLKVKD